MKKVLVAVLVLSLFLAGCGPSGSSVDTSDTSDISSDADIDINTDDGKVSVEKTGDKTTISVQSDDGKDMDVEVTTLNRGSGDWCPVGGEWKYATTVDQGSVQGQWEVLGFETSGEYKGLCHVKYKVEQAGQTINMEYWFEEGGKDGYVKMNAGGQEFVQEWHSE
ncbi:MAG: hypothetical protein ABIJ08_01115 [Nanoarchaeota archaeon]